MTDIEDVFGNTYDRGVDDHERLAASLIEAATEGVMKKYKFITIEETGQCWYYKEGVYVPDGEILIAKDVEKVFGYKLTKGKLSEIIAHVRRRTYHKHEELDADTNIINLKNGLYDINEDKLLSHTPDYLSTNQKPIVYLKGAKPKLFGGFLKQVLYARDIRTAIDAMAYTFNRDYIVEVVFILHGLGANGKTVYIKVLISLHGRDNVSNVPLSDILSDRFALSDLENKDLNIDNELSGQTIREASILKRLTGGSRQRVRIQRKGEKAYDTTLYPKLFFCANKIPQSHDTTDAYNRRIIIIVFPNRFEGKSEDKQLISKLTTQEEISGIFNVLMSALRRIRRNNELYVNEKTIEERRKKYERALNPFKTFREEAVLESPEDWVPKDVLYNAFLKYCHEYNLPYEKYDAFCKSVKNDNVEQTRPEINGSRVQCWKGITLKSETDQKTLD